jgi:hypothetical protein
LIESDSLETSKCVKALRGTGTEIVGLVVLLLPDDDDPEVLVVGREVPFTDVVALEETPVLVLALERTVAFEVEADESDELGFALIAAADVVVPFVEDNDEVDDAGVERPELVDGVSSAFPEEALVPEPAPEDEPALFDAMAAGAVAMEVD